MTLGLRQHTTKGRNAHHLWSAERGEDGKLQIVRSREEPEMFENEKHRKSVHLML